MKNSQKILSVFILIFTLSSLFVGCQPQTNEGTEKIIAEYEGGNVNETEFQQYLRIAQFFDPEFKPDELTQETKGQILETYIAEKYLSEQTKEKPTTEAKEMLEYLKAQKIQLLGSEKEYDKLLTDLSLKEKDILAYLEKLYSIQNYFIEKKYKENKEEFTVATVSHILVTIDDQRTEEEAKKRAEEVLSKLKEGQDFSQLAKEYSDDPGSKDNGGTYENAPILLWVPEFKEAALTLPLNEISGLVKTDFGYHIIKVSSREIPEIKDISEQIKNQVMSEGYSQFINEELPSIITKTDLPAN